MQKAAGTVDDVSERKNLAAKSLIVVTRGSQLALIDLVECIPVLLRDTAVLEVDDESC
jgi:hypothetical protein